jgi:hypothetical protein
MKNLNKKIESVYEIVDYNCIRCGEKIDCRRFICEKCFNEISKGAEKKNG